MKNRAERVYRGRRNDMSHKLFDRTCQANGLHYVETTQLWNVEREGQKPGTIIIDVTPKTTRRALLMSLLAQAQRIREENPTTETPTTEAAPEEAADAGALNA